MTGTQQGARAKKPRAEITDAASADSAEKVGNLMVLGSKVLEASPTVIPRASLSGYAKSAALKAAGKVVIKIDPNPAYDDEPYEDVGFGD